MFVWRRFLALMAITLLMVVFEPVLWVFFVMPRMDLLAAVLALWVWGFCTLWAGCWMSVVASFRGWNS